MSFWDITRHEHVFGDISQIVHLPGYPSSGHEHFYSQNVLKNVLNLWDISQIVHLLGYAHVRGNK